MKSRMKNLINSVIFLFLISSTISYIGQSQEQKEAKLHEEVYVIVKLIEVYVTDRQGEPIKDLSSSDFIVKKDNEVVPISYFERREININVEEKVEKIKEKDRVVEQGRKFLFLFDFAHNTPKGIKLLKKASLYLLSQLQPRDKIGIVTYSATKGLTVHEYFTNDHEKIEKVINEFETKEICGRAEIMDEYLKDLWEDEMPLGPTIKKERSDSYPFERANARAQLLHFCNSLRKLALFLRYIPGYKHIVLFSVGPYQDLIYGKAFSNVDFGFLSPPPQYRSEFYGETSLRQEYERMAKEFSSSNCIIYSVNTEGLPEGKALALGTSQKGEHSLLRLSQITGGKYYPNTEDLRPAVEDIAKRTSFYYVIGIPVKEEMDGKFHRIEVKVRRKGVRVHAPSGYYNPKPFKEYTEFEKFLHLVDTALSEKPLFGEVKEFPLSLNLIDRDKNIFELSFDILKEDYKGEEGEVFTIFFDSKKEIIKVRRERFRLSEDAESFSYKRVIEIPSEAEEIRVVIRDLQSGRAMRGIAKLRRQ